MVFRLFLLVASALGDVLYHFGSSFGQTYVNQLEDKTKIAVNGKSVGIDNYDAIPTDRGIYVTSPSSRVYGFPNDLTPSYDEITSEFSMAMWYFNVQKNEEAPCFYRYIKNGIAVILVPGDTLYFFFSCPYFFYAKVRNFYLENWAFISVIVAEDYLKLFINNIFKAR